MTLAVSKPNNQQQSLYESDLNLWLEQTIAQLKVGDLPNLDITNSVEELDGSF